MTKYKRSTTMVDYDYRVNLNAREARRRRVRTFLAAFFITIALATAGIVYDALRSKTIITTTKPNTATLGATSQQQVFDTTAFNFETSGGWERVTQIPTTYRQYQPYRYIYRDNNNLVRRELYIFMDNIPEQQAINYALPVEIQNNTIEPLGGISPRCSTLVNNPLQIEKVEVEWGGVHFVCQTEGSDYLVGAVHNSMGYGLQLAGASAVHRYFFLYHDVSSSQRYDVFTNILRSFRTK